MKYKISLIIPVYNMEKYLDRCLESVATQSFKEFEAIIVNDGSKDGSQIIIDKFVKKYPKIFKSFINKNSGVSMARNFGISKSVGKYIMFLDSDDFIQKDMLKEMYEKIEEGFDVVSCNVLEFYDNPKRNREISSGLTKDIPNLSEEKEILIKFYPTVWNKIYRADFLKNSGVLFKKGVWFEDVEFLYRLFPHIKSIGQIDKPFVYYYQRIGSISKSFDDRIIDYIENMNSVVEYYKQNGFFNTYRDEIEYAYVRYLYATMLRVASKNAIKGKDYKKYKVLLKSAIKNVKTTFPKYRKNKYLYKNLKGIYLLSFNYLTGIMLYWTTRKLK